MVLNDAQKAMAQMEAIVNIVIVTQQSHTIHGTNGIFTYMNGRFFMVFM